MENYFICCEVRNVDDGDDDDDDDDDKHRPLIHFLIVLSTFIPYPL